MIKNLKRFLVPLALLSLGTTGCVVTESSASGFLTIDWYIEDDTIARDCLLTGASYMNVVIEDNFGDIVVDELAACEDFTMTFELDEGAYFPDVTLLDLLERPITDTLILAPVDIFDRDDFIVEVDFFIGDFF